MSFGQIFRKSPRNGSLALAMALACGAMVGTAVVETPAYAQKKKKKAEKPKYSDGFVAAYSPLNDSVKESADPSVLLAGVAGLEASLETADDKFAGGNLLYTIGQRANDPALQLRGVETMLESQKVPAENAGAYNFLAGQLAYNQSQYARSRGHFQNAIALGYTQNDPEAIVAETYFSEDDYVGGLGYLTSLIDQRKAAGQPVSIDWVKRGLAVAYNNDRTPEALKFARIYAEEFPSQSSWGDAIAIVLNTSNYEYPEILDLLRLARRTDTLRDRNMFLEYIEAADARRNPAEVIAVIDQGYASGNLDRSNGFVADSRSLAQGRLAADQRDLPALSRDARAGSAGLRTVMAAANANLSYDKAAEAEEFYSKAAGMAGADMPVTLTRLGIAQLDQGKYAEASATFAKVTGPRKAITDLYGVWAKQKMEAAPAATAVPAATEVVTETVSAS